jgi:hypothetical protein
MTTLVTDQNWPFSRFHISYQNSKISWQSFQKNKFFIEEIQFSGTFFVINIFWKLQFLKYLKHFLQKLHPFFVSWFWSFFKQYEFDLRVIFDQWPKLHLGLDMQPKIPILKGL